jgi:hypothetical protein|tara:strand:+ start:247 stop:423 length:177 start_codon:yes stop_codon:yes gene_type:complete
MRVINWVHSDTSGLGPFPFPTVPAGFTDLYEFMFRISYGPNGGHGIDWHSSHFGAWKT